MLLNALQLTPVVLYYFFPVWANLLYLLIGLTLSLLYMLSSCHLRSCLMIFFYLSCLLLISKVMIAGLIDLNLFENSEKWPWISWFLCQEYSNQSFDFMSMIPDVSFLFIFILLSQVESYVKPKSRTKVLAKAVGFFALAALSGLFLGYFRVFYSLMLLAWLFVDVYFERSYSKIVEKFLAVGLLIHIGLAFVDFKLELLEDLKLVLQISTGDPISWVVFGAFVAISSDLDAYSLRYYDIEANRRFYGAYILTRSKTGIDKPLLKDNETKVKKNIKNNESSSDEDDSKKSNSDDNSKIFKNLEIPEMKSSNSEIPFDHNRENKLTEIQNPSNQRSISVSKFNTTQKNPTNKSSSSSKSMIFLYLLFKLNLCFLVEVTSNITSLLLITWFGFILICKNQETTKWVNLYILNLALIILSLLNLFFPSIFLDESWTIFPLLSAVILSGFLSKNCNYLSSNNTSPTSWYIEITIWAISNTSFLLVLVLFITGLAKINLIHLGLLIFCLVYIKKQNLTKVNWSFLIIYLVFIIFIRKLWEICKVYQDISRHIIEFIGLESSSNSVDLVYWVILFLYGFLRFLANIPKTQDLNSTTEGIKKKIKMIFEWFRILEVLIIYSAMFYGIFYTDKNFLNFFRSFLVLVLIIQNLGHPDSSISRNFKKSFIFIKILRIYCAILLCIRYAFQFLIYFDDYSVLDKVGLEVYDKTFMVYSNFAVDSLYAFGCIRLWISCKNENTGMKEVIDGELNAENIDNKENSTEKGIDLKHYQKKFRKFYVKFIFSVLHLIIFVVIAWLAVYWKLSLSMGMYLVVVLVYCTQLTFFSYTTINVLTKILSDNQDEIMELKNELNNINVSEKDKNLLFQELASRENELFQFEKMSEDPKFQENNMRTNYIQKIKEEIIQLQTNKQDLTRKLKEKKNFLKQLKLKQENIEKDYNNKMNKIIEFEWHLRVKLWRQLMTLSLINICMGYLRYFCLMEISEFDPMIETIYLCLGFSKFKSSLFIDIYGYLIVFVSVIVLRFAISETKPKVRAAKINKDYWDQQISLTGQLKRGDTFGKKLIEKAVEKGMKNTISNYFIIRKIQRIKNKLSKYRMIIFFQDSFKQLIYVLVFIVAIQRFSLFSVIELFMITIAFCFKYPKREILSAITLFFSMITQYFIYIISLNSIISPEMMPDYIAKILKNFGILEFLEGRSVNQQMTISFLGLTKIQFNLVFWQLFTCTMIMFLLIHLSWTKQNEKLCNLILPSPHSIKNNELIPKEVIITKSFMYTVISLIYKFSRFFLILLAFFISVLSKSLFSIIYFACCSYFLYTENLLILHQDEKKENKDKILVKVNDEDDLPDEKNPEPHKLVTKSQTLTYDRIKNDGELTSQNNPDEKTIIKKVLNDKIGNYQTILNIFIAINFIEIWFNFSYNIYSFYLKKNSCLHPEDKFCNLTNTENAIYKISLQAIVLCMAMFIKSMLKDPYSREYQINEIFRIKQESRKIFKNMTWVFYRLMHKRKKANLAKKEKLEKKMSDLNPVKVSFEESIRQNCQLTPSMSNPESFNKLHFPKKTFESESNILSEVLIYCINYSLFDKRMQKFLIPGIDLENKREISKKHKDLTKSRENLFTTGKLRLELDLFNITRRVSLTSYEPLASERLSLQSPRDHQVKLDPQSNPPRLVLHTSYRVSWKDIPELLCYALISNMDYVVYTSFVINHMQYGRIESLIFPLTVFAYAILEFPRPPMRYFRIMLLYTFAVILGKLLFQLDILEKNKWVQEFQDPFYFGFRRVKDNEFFGYIFWDIVVIFSLLCREYFIIRIGVWTRKEIDVDAYSEVKEWLTRSQEDWQGAKFSSSWREQVEKWLESIKTTSFFKRLVPEVSFVKPGTDLYLCTYTMQVVIFVFLIVWFNKIDGFHEDISTSIKASTFQGRMVLVLLFMICLIVFDRYVYLKHSSIVTGEVSPSTKPKDGWNRMKSLRSNVFKQTSNISETQKLDYNTENKKNIEMLLKIKLTLHYLLLISVHIVIFWYLPYETRTKDGYQKNNYIKALYLLFIIYIAFQSLQFKLGLPTFRKYSFPLLKKPTASSKMMIKIFRLLPFVYEIRTLIDWTFTKTALNLFQWTKLEEIQFRIFFNECTQNSLKYRRPGETIQIKEKCMYGIIPLIIVILIIVLPLVIFSTLNPLSYPNKILQASLEVKLLINDRSFNLYSVNSADSIINVDEFLFNKEGFDQSVEMNPDDYTRMQQINMPIGPDLNWEATDLAEIRMKKLLNGHLHEGTNTTVKARLEISILREYPRKYEKSKIINEKELSRENSENLLDVLENHSNKEIVVESLLYTAFRLPSVGTDINFISYSQNDYTAPLNISLFRHENGRYWKVAFDWDEGGEIGPRFYVISDNYYIGAFNFSVVTFYVSIVYLLARVIRNIFFTYSMNIVMTDTKNYEYLQALCSMIYVSRMTGNIYEEELFYYELIDVLRSPELIKVITKSSKLKDKLD